MSIYRKLKDYIQHKEGDENHCSSTTLIFGDLMSRECCFDYEDDNGEWREWFGVGIYGHEMDYLLNYYVVGIHPKYKIEKDKIIPFLHITLYKEKPNYE